MPATRYGIDVLNRVNLSFLEMQKDLLRLLKSTLSDYLIAINTRNLISKKAKNIATLTRRATILEQVVL